MRYKITVNNKKYVVSAKDVNSALSALAEFEDGVSPMTYKKLKEEGYTREDWKDWSDEEKFEKSQTGKTNQSNQVEKTAQHTTSSSGSNSQNAEINKSSEAKERWRKAFENDVENRRKNGYEITTDDEVRSVQDQADEAIKTVKNKHIARVLTEYKELVSKEPEYSKQMVDIAKQTDSVLIGYEHRLKTLDSLTDKLNRPGTDASTYELTDTVRYTFEANDAETVTRIMDKLVESGYTVDKFKNTWLLPESVYRGINVKLVSSSGDVIEVQFHTIDDLVIKEYNHANYYEKQRKLPEGTEEYTKYDVLQKEQTKTLKTPNGFDKLKYIIQN